MTSKEFGKILQDKLTSEYGVELNVASNQQIYRSLALICRQMMSENHKKFQSKAIGTGTKQVYYLCMEFLMGRSLKMSLFNLGLDEVAKKALADADINLDSIFEEEPDAGLGNGGLGRLAACYLEGMATTDICGTGYSILYAVSYTHLAVYKRQAQFLRHGGVVDHAAAAEGHLAAILHSQIDDLLHAVDVGRKGRNDDTLVAGAGKQAAHTGGHLLLGSSKARALRVGGVAQQSQHTALSVLGQGGQVGHAASQRGVINFKVAGLDDGTGGAVDSKSHSIRDRVVDMDGLHGKACLLYTSRCV